MTLPFEGEAPKCALPSCKSPKPKLYDDRKERYFCDMQCFREYMADNLKEFAQYYADHNFYEET